MTDLKITSEHPVIYSNACGCEKSSSLDGSSSSSAISAFQSWANSKGYKDMNGGSLVVDGKWGPKTASVWSKYGSSYNAPSGSSGATVAKPMTSSASSATSKKPTPSSSGSISAAEPEEEKKGFASWSTNKKVAVIGSGVLVLGIITYFAFRGKKKQA